MYSHSLVQHQNQLTSLSLHNPFLSVHAINTSMPFVFLHNRRVFKDFSHKNMYARLMCQVGLLMYPVVCTMLLRVFDCRTIEGVEGSWLRADRAIKCQSDQHHNYQVSANLFRATPPFLRQAISTWF